jgi:hypothetical protein
MNENFHLNEYNALRGEILENIRQIGEINKFVLVSVAISVGWLLNQAGHLDGLTSLIGAWIPFFVTQWFAAYRRDLTEAIYMTADYLKKIEKTYGSDKLGWQSTVREMDGKRTTMFNRTKLVNRLVAISSLIFAIYYIARYSVKLSIFNLS